MGPPLSSSACSIQALYRGYRIRKHLVMNVRRKFNSLSDQLLAEAFDNESNEVNLDDIASRWKGFESFDESTQHGLQVPHPLPMEPLRTPSKAASISSTTSAKTMEKPAVSSASTPPGESIKECLPSNSSLPVINLLQQQQQQKEGSTSSSRPQALSSAVANEEIESTAASSSLPPSTASSSSPSSLPHIISSSSSSTTSTTKEEEHEEIRQEQEHEKEPIVDRRELEAELEWIKASIKTRIQLLRQQEHQQQDQQDVRKMRRVATN